MSLPRSYPSNTLAAAFAVGSVLVADLVNRQVPHPYVDEIFHVPQARLTCVGNYVRYDPKLTTPPGLYLVSRILSQVLPFFECGDLVFLRSTNLVMLMSIPHLIAAIIELNREENERWAIELEKRKLHAQGGPGAPVELPPAYSEQAVEGARARIALAPNSAAASAMASSRPFSAPISSRAQTERGGLSRNTIRALQEKAKREAAEMSLDNGAADSGSARARLPITSSLSAVYGSSAVQRRLRRKKDEAWRVAVAHTITFLPPLWFFGFLYYTDVGSVCFVLATLLSVKNGQRTLGAVLGAISLLFRQTNIVWLLFVLCSSLLSDLAFSFSKLHDPLLAHATSLSLFRSVSSFFGTFNNAASLLELSRLLRKHFAPFLPVFIGFACFVRWNGSIVLGDKSNHQAGVHVPQLFYFILFATFFGWPSLLAAAAPRVKEAESRSRAIIAAPAALLRIAATSLAGSPLALLGTTLAVFAIALAVDGFTIEHPFLLADNRHYTFYLWKNVWKRHELVKFAFVPIYLVCGRLWLNAIGRSTTLLWTLGFVLATALTLVPSPLIEPRYFLIPYLLLRIHTTASEDQAANAGNSAALGTGTDFFAPSPPSPAEPRTMRVLQAWLRRTEASISAKHVFLLVEFVWLLAINVLTMWLFLYRPFQWPEDGVDTQRGEGTTMRFMW